MTRVCYGHSEHSQVSVCHQQSYSVIIRFLSRFMTGDVHRWEIITFAMNKANEKEFIICPLEFLTSQMCFSSGPSTRTHTI